MLAERAESRRIRWKWVAVGLVCYVVASVPVVLCWEVGKWMLSTLG